MSKLIKFIKNFLGLKEKQKKKMNISENIFKFSMAIDVNSK